jgi:hypothetical protein
VATYANDMKSLEELEESFLCAKEDGKLFSQKGNKSAGTRLRKRMLEIIKFAKLIRSEVSEIKNS